MKLTSLSKTCLVFTFFLLASATMGTAQTATTPASTDPRLDPLRIELGGEEVPMSLAEVVMRTFEQNLDIQISFIDVGIARDAYQGQQGIYDPVLGARVGAGHREGENNDPVSALAIPNRGARVTEDGTTEYFIATEETGVSLTQLIPTGATITLGFDRTRTDWDDNRSTPFVVNPEENQRAYVRFSQPLLKNFGPKVTNLGIRTARLDEEITRRFYYHDVEDRLASVMTAYWDLVFAIRNLEVQRASLEAALELERVNEVRLRTGSAPKSDLYQAQSEVAQRRNSVITAKSAILDAQDRLLRLMNWSEPVESWNRPIVPTDRPDSYDLALTLEDSMVIAEAFADRHDLEAARLAREQSLITKDALWWQRFPELNAIAEYGLNGMSDSFGDAREEVTQGNYEDYFVGLEFRYPLLNRRARADYRASKKRLERSELVIDNLQLFIATEVRGATRAIRTAQESIEASEAQVTAAESTLEAEQKRLEVGSSTTFNVLRLQEDLVEAQVNQVRSRVNYQKGLIELQRSRGRLVESIGEDLGIVFEFDGLVADAEK